MSELCLCDRFLMDLHGYIQDCHSLRSGFLYQTYIGTSPYRTLDVV